MTDACIALIALCSPDRLEELHDVALGLRVEPGDDVGHRRARARCGEEDGGEQLRGGRVPEVRVGERSFAGRRALGEPRGRPSGDRPVPAAVER